VAPAVDIGIFGPLAFVLRPAPHAEQEVSANFRSPIGGSFPRLIRSGPIPIGGFEEGEFKADSPTGEVAAQVCLRGADAVQSARKKSTKLRKSGLSCSVTPSACTKLAGSGCGAREAQSR